MPVDISNMLQRVREDIFVTTGRAVIECTPNSMKVPSYLNIPFVHPFIRAWLVETTADSSPIPIGTLKFLSVFAAQLYMTLVRSHLQDIFFYFLIVFIYLFWG